MISINELGKINTKFLELIQIYESSTITKIAEQVLFETCFEMGEKNHEKEMHNYIYSTF